SQGAVLIRDQHRVGSTLLDLNFVRVARSTVASNCDKITALDSNACIGNVLDVLFDGVVCIAINNDRTAVHNGLEALNDRGRNADNKLHLFLVDICIGTVRIVNNLGNGLVILHNALDSSPLQVAVLIRDQHRVGSTLLDLNFVRVAISTVSSNCEILPPLKTNLFPYTTLFRSFDGVVCIAINNDRTAVHNGLEALNDRGRN